MRFNALLSVLLVWPVLFLASGAFALSDDAEKGRQYFAVCDACHNPSLNPSLAPPMWSVQRRYQTMTADKEKFIERLVAFVRRPSVEKANFKEAISMHGLMPLISLPEEALKEVATYIAETEFAPPCGHWKSTITRLEASGQTEQADQNRNSISEYCE